MTLSVGGQPASAFLTALADYTGDAEVLPSAHVVDNLGLDSLGLVEVLAITSAAVGLVVELDADRLPDARPWTALTAAELAACVVAS